ncbi:MAG TPA: hypothetical protein VEV42_02055 [Pyrinomonadaceae bacterium]|nr:hypothetical protein [Pyrinomonadaceae bacterium]
MKSVFVALALMVLSTGITVAQKGTAEPDYYPSGYSGDTWTGLVTSVSDDTREFTLTYKKGEKEQTFTGVLPKGYTVKMKDGSDHEVKLDELMGMRLKVYYMTKTKKVNGEKVKTNEVFQIKFLPPEK